MDVSLLNAIPSEEIKIASIENAICKSLIMKNPLVSNKGSARLYTDISIAAKEPPLPLCLPFHIKPSLCSAKESKLALPKVSLPDECHSILSEMNSTERFNRLSNVFQPPLFEVRNTMLELMAKQQLNCGGSKSCEAEYEVLRAKTVEGTKRPEAEDMVEELTPEEFQYFTLMNQITVNYLCQALSFNKVYSQYVALSRANMAFLNSSDFLSRRKAILRQKRKFAQNTYKYHGNSAFNA
eukprot:TRINITY_DN2879_c0_g2_i16.p1 TRINITY_DN2879_c0_g2~~TRINITY_DN2879_c0_g2_i16.p1  ORF type:complete len:239 (-),score=55.55 TRINITY_DN2879_c0_g2_i16:688-1404(-)